jgi:Putative protein-S-isoprenylcysteine methyltransferase
MNPQFFNAPSWAVVALAVVAVLLGTPVLAKGFSRRGKGVFYEQNFLIQRAPQLCSLLNIAVIFVSFYVYNNQLSLPMGIPVFSLSGPEAGPLMAVSWLGVVIMISGLIFMIGGWYSLGEAFSTDAELLEGQKVKDTGLLRFVMHPAYSGIIQSLVGASVAALSPLSLAIALFLVAPLWLRRAKYEEALLMKTFGDNYKDYAQKLKWRRLVPSFIPIGV